MKWLPPLFLVWIFLFFLSCGMASEWLVLIAPSGSARLEYADKLLGSMTPGLFEATWQGASMSPGRAGAATPADGVRRGEIRAPSGKIVDVELRATRLPNGVRMQYRLTPREEIRLNSLHVSLNGPTGNFRGAKFVAEGVEQEFPAQFKDVHLRNAEMRSLKLVFADGRALNFDFAVPTPVLIQDDRQWGDAFSIRIGPQSDASSPWPAGRLLELDFSLTTGGKMKVEDDGPVTIVAGEEWVPLELELNIEPGSALDFSKLIEWHAPAGELGAVQARGGHFVFERRPHTPVRFYGVNFAFGAQYLPKERCDLLAQRLRCLGYNSVRIHHHEGELVDRSKGDSVTLNPKKLDQLDYLFAAFKREGLYVTTDLFVSRPVFAAEIYEGERGDFGMDNYKMAVLINARARENLKAFCRALLDHKNPYTELRWADDPALFALSLVNENNPGNFIQGLQGKLREDWMRAWNRWLVERYPDRAALVKAMGQLPDVQDPKKGNVPFENPYGDTPAARLFNAFLAETHMRFFADMKKFLREELGCKTLLTDLNSWHNAVQLQASRAQFDYVDDHFYVDHPEFLERSWQLPSKSPNTSPISGGASGGRSSAFTRFLDKPFTITEYNYSAPGRFRGVGGILTGAMGAVQDWSGIWRFAYSHNRDNLFKPSPMNYFDMTSDPLGQAAERASLCLFLRGDLSPAKHSIAVAMSKEELLNNPRTSRDRSPPWNGLALVTRVGTIVGEDPGKNKNVDIVVPLSKAYGDDVGTELLTELRQKGWVRTDNPTDLKKNIYQSDNGQYTINAPENIMRLDTPRTAGGFAPAGKTIQTRVATIEIHDTEATVWISSVDGRPLYTSRRMIITHLTDLQNTETKYADRSRQVLQAWGKLPHLVRAGRATITLRTPQADRLKVYALSTSGKRLGEVPARAAGRALTIPLSIAAGGTARMLYEVEVSR